MIDMDIRIHILLISFFLGGAIGLFHFGGLWWTICRIADSRNKDYEFIISFFLRTGISIGLFYLISAGRWEKILAALAGFLAVRYVMVRKIGAITNHLTSVTKDNIHGY